MTELLKALNKKGYDYDSKEKKMISKKNKSSSDDDFKCYNCGDLSYMKRDCPKPRKSSAMKGKPRRKFSNKWKSFKSTVTTGLFKIPA